MKLATRVVDQIKSKAHKIVRGGFRREAFSRLALTDSLAMPNPDAGFAIS